DGYGVRGVRKIILFAESAVDAPCHNGGRRTLYSARVSTQQNRERDFRVRVIGVGKEPAYFRRGRVVVASARLPERHLVSAPVETGFAGPIKHRGEQALADFRQYRTNVQFPLHARREILNLFLAVRILQIIKRSAIGEGSRERGKLQRGHL